MLGCYFSHAPTPQQQSTAIAKAHGVAESKLPYSRSAQHGIAVEKNMFWDALLTLFGFQTGQL